MLSVCGKLHNISSLINTALVLFLLVIKVKPATRIWFVVLVKEESKKKNAKCKKQDSESRLAQEFFYQKYENNSGERIKSLKVPTI